MNIKVRNNYYYENIRINNRKNTYINRTRVVKREKLIISSIFCFALIMSFLFFSLKVNAGNIDKNSDSVKMYKSVTIYFGDTFESIAEEYMTEDYASEAKYIKELMAINGMSEASKLIPGNNIIIPFYMSKSIEDNRVVEFSLAR